MNRAQLLAQYDIIDGPELRASLLLGRAPLRAMLHCLRDRLMIDEAAQLGDQIPVSWRVSIPPEQRPRARR
jgi:hypothetical protein